MPPSLLSPSTRCCVCVLVVGVPCCLCGGSCVLLVFQDVEGRWTDISCNGRQERRGEERGVYLK